jgi:hypothetical protein
MAVSGLERVKLDKGDNGAALVLTQKFAKS